MAKRRRTRWITNATGRRGERRSARSRQRAVGTVREPQLGGRRVAPRASDATRRAEAGLERPVRRPGGVSESPDCSASMLRSKRRADAHLSARKFVATERDILACLPSAYGDEVCASPGPRTHATRPTRAPKTQCARPGGALSAKVSRVWGDLWRGGSDKCRQMRLSVFTTTEKRRRTRGLFFRSPPPDGVSPPKTTRQPRRRRKPNQKPRRNRTLHPAPPTPAGRIRSPRRRRR